MYLFSLTGLSENLFKGRDRVLVISVSPGPSMGLAYSRYLINNSGEAEVNVGWKKQSFPFAMGHLHAVPRGHV